jgi:hypothetical protein
MKELLEVLDRLAREMSLEQWLISIVLGVVGGLFLAYLHGLLLGLF